jgi:hypothetical protein
MLWLPFIIIKCLPISSMMARLLLSSIPSIIRKETKINKKHLSYILRSIKYLFWSKKSEYQLCHLIHPLLKIIRDQKHIWKWTSSKYGILKQDILKRRHRQS